MQATGMTTRRWIVAVMISAALMGIIVEINREIGLASQYRLKAKIHNFNEKSQAASVDRGRFRLPASSNPAGFYVFTIPSPAVAAYHAAMRKKYERAASRPWASVEPDPPEPK